MVREKLLMSFVQEADINGDQHISFDEFKDIFNEAGWALIKVSNETGCAGKVSFNKDDTV